MTTNKLLATAAKLAAIVAHYKIQAEIRASTGEDEPLDEDETETLANMFLIELNNLNGNE